MKHLAITLFSIIGICCSVYGNYLAADTSTSTQTAQSVSTIIELNQENIQKTLDSAHFLVIDAYADWCGPCKRLSPIFHELSQEYGTQYQFAKVNVDKEDAVAERFSVTGLPTILFIKDGKEIGRQVGFMKKEQFTNALKQHFKD